MSQHINTPVIHELNHIALHVRDLEASERFYGEVLGIPRLERAGFNFRGAWFALGSQELHLIEGSPNQPVNPHSFHFALRVDDALAMYAMLKPQDIPTLGEPNTRPDGAVQVFLRDPDGFLIEIMSPGKSAER
jgi:catechol 2,3-dioxygenase-like lactoylglutathione lyase family enzyme